MHLVGFYYKNISRCTVRCMSNGYTSKMIHRYRNTRKETHVLLLFENLWLFHLFSPHCLIKVLCIIICYVTLRYFIVHVFLLRPQLFCVITQPVVAISYRRFGTNYLSHPQGSRIQEKAFLLDSGTLRMRPIGCFETSVRNCHYWLCNNPSERISQLLRGGSLK